MASKRLPEKIQMGKDGPIYELGLFIIRSTNVRGVPLECTFVKDEQAVKIEEGMRFMTAYLPAEMLTGDIL